MSTRGRKPKPTAVKVLEGNPGKRPLNMFEPTPDKVAPECPDWLNEEAKAEWDRLVDKMVELGTLTEMDMAAFAGYCQSYARWKEAEEFIEKHGTIVKLRVDTGSRFHRFLLHRQILRSCLSFVVSLV